MSTSEEFRKILPLEILELHQLTRFYTVVLAWEILDSSGISNFLKKQPGNPIQIMKGLGFKPYCLPALNWLLDFTTANGLLFQESAKGKISYSFSSKEILEKKILELDSRLKPLLEYLSLLAADYPRFFKGEKSGPDIVFLNDRVKYWNYYFGNDYPTYRVVNQLGSLITSVVIGSQPQFKMLEIGSGTGGAAAALLQRLKETGQLSQMQKYHYTDISSGFLKNATTIFSEYAPNTPYEAQVLDINIPLAEQGFPDQSLDFIYSVNCVHVAKNLIEALQHVRKSLKPGGRLILCEAVRGSMKRPLQEEMIFCLLSSYTDVRLLADIRPTIGFLSTMNWIQILKEVGFSQVEIHSDAMAYGFSEAQESVAVIVATNSN